MLQLIRSLRLAVNGVFREREIYVRSQGHIRYITLKPHMLVLGVSLLISVVGIGITSTIGYFAARGPSMVEQNKPIKTTNSPYSDKNETILVQLNRTKKNLQITRNKRIERQETRPHDLKKVPHIQKLRNAYERQIARQQSTIHQFNARMVRKQEAYQSDLEEVRSLYKALLQRHARLEDLVDQGWTPRMVTLAEPDETDKPRLDAGEIQPEPERNVKKAGQTNHSALKTNIPLKTGAQFNSEGLPPPPPVSPIPLHPAQKPIDTSGLKSSMSEHLDRQDQTSRRINVSAQKRVREMTEVLSKLNFDLSKLKPNTKPSGPANSGGPFIALPNAQAAGKPRNPGKTEFADLLPFKKISLMEKALLELPIRRPLANLRSISSPYGPRMDPFSNRYALHRGIDMRASIGEPVLASAAGIVLSTEHHSKTGFGKVIVLRHKHGLTTLYGHLNEILVKKGDRVKPGDVVGKAGNTGRSTGPHLHYEVRVDDSHVDPIDYLEAATHVF